MPRTVSNRLHPIFAFGSTDAKGARLRSSRSRFRNDDNRPRPSFASGSTAARVAGSLRALRAARGRLHNAETPFRPSFRQVAQKRYGFRTASHSLSVSSSLEVNW